MSTTQHRQLLCQQCSAPLAIEAGSQLVVCEFCQTTNYVDKSKTIQHYALRPTLRDSDAVAALRRWMAGNDTIKGLDQKAQIAAPKYELFPMWLVRASANGSEKRFLEPAAAVSISALKQLTIPAADLEPYDHELDDDAIDPTVPFSVMETWLKNDYQVEPADIIEVSLVHIPLYVFKYQFEDETYTAYVDAATSRVMASIFPSKWEVPYVAIGIIAFALNFCIATIPLGGLILGDFTGLATGVLIYLVAVVVAAIPIFLIGAYVSSRA